MQKRPRTALLIFTAAVAVAILVVGLHAAWIERTAQKSRTEALRLLERLELTDLCLFPESPHTRHPAVADRHAAFGLHPLAFDPHPTGMIVRPPHTLRTP